MKILNYLRKFPQVSLIFLVIIGVAGYGLSKIIKFSHPESVDCSNVPKAENAVVIQMENHKFNPETLTAKVCDTLLFLNLDDEEKWPQSSLFDAGRSMPKFDFYEFQVTRTGTYLFYDHLHEDMKGKLTINK